MMTSREIKEKLVALVKEDPSLPIIAWVDSEVVCEDSGWWAGQFSGVDITEYVGLEVYGEFKYFEKDDIGEIEEFFCEQLLDENPDLTDEEVEELAKTKAKELNWTKAIVVYVSPGLEID